MQTQTNLENQIQQRFQTPAAGKHLKPYQGLKRPHRIGAANVSSRKTPKTLSGIETQPNHYGGSFYGNAGKHLKPYQGLKLGSK